MADALESYLDVAGVLARLGSPEHLASLYAAERLLVRAERGGSPWLLATALLRWASVSAAGYLLAAGFFIAALVKPFAPGRVGLWRTADALSLHLGLAGGPAPRGEELLGWWIVPIGLLLGAAAAWLTARLARWAIRRFRPQPFAAVR
jgi:hypothetical protein